MSEERAERLAEAVKRLVKKWLLTGKTGNIQVNTFKGGISSINLNQTVKVGEE
jgi:hypothetical protein